MFFCFEARLRLIALFLILEDNKEQSINQNPLNLDPFLLNKRFLKYILLSES